MRAVVLGLVVMIATPLAALTPDPVCGLDERTGAVWPIEDPRATLVLDPVYWPGPVVSFEWTGPDGRALGVVQHCPTDQTVIYVIEAERLDALRARLHEMLGAEVAHGMDDLRREVRQSGGRAQIQQVGPGRCLCDQAGG